MSAAANAQQIATRANLNSLLATSTTDNFEALNIFPGTGVNMGVSSLDSTTVIGTQGPNLVKPGATYRSTTGTNLQWNGDTYYSLVTETILANGPNGSLEIDYANATQAMGLDANNFQGYGYSGTMSVYNGTSLVGTLNFSLSGNGGETAFLGWQNASGITKVVLSSPTYTWSPIIDNHTYGTFSSVPEPGSLLVLGMGAVMFVRRRRTK